MMKIGLSNTSIKGGVFPGTKDNGRFAAKNSVSFSGLNLDRITNNAKSAALKISDYSTFTKGADIYVGKDFVQDMLRKFRVDMGSKSDKFVKLENNMLIFRKESIPLKIKEGIANVIKLPIDILDAAISQAGDITGPGGNEFAAKLKNLEVFKRRRNEKEAMTIYHQLKGIAEAKTPFELRETILHVPAGKPVGNYDSKDERALNRLATGFVSSMFVGTDFYNLVMYEKNNKKEAEKAKKKRRSRELSRYALTAFMTYSVLGALSSYALKSKAIACAALAGSALFSEIVTRLVTGTPLRPLTPEGAKKYNEKRRAKSIENSKNDSKASEVKMNTIASVTDTGVFTEFKTPAISFTSQKTTIPQQNTPPVQVKKNKDTASKKAADKNKSPLTLKNVSIAAAVLTALNVLYALGKQKNPNFRKLTENFNLFFQDFYNKYAKNDLIVQNKELRSFLRGFKDCNMGDISQAYARILDVKFTPEEAKTLVEKYSANGNVVIEPSNEIFQKAYERTSKQTFEGYLNSVYKQEGQEWIDKKKKIVFDEIDYIAKTPKAHKFESIKIRMRGNELPLNLDEAEYNFGRIKNTKLKVLLDAVSYPLKMIKNIISLPTKLFRAATKTGPKPPEKEVFDFEPIDLGELYRDCMVMRNKFAVGKIDLRDFQKYIEIVNTKPFNKDGAPSYPATSLAFVSRNFVTLIASYFFINDFRNEVLIQSNGENTEKAAEVTKERIAHKVSNFAFNMFFMELFNHTFNKLYLGSLLGATAVAAATEVTNESAVRLSIGIPLTQKGSREEIQELEEKHVNKKGIVGAYYRMMARLTGKKMLSEKAEGSK